MSHHVPGGLAGLPRLVAGWTLTVAGVALVPLPGPGTVVLVAGIGLLAPHYAWARRLLDPLRTRAVAAASYGAATWPRVVASVLGAVAVVALGALWWVDPAFTSRDVLGLRVGPHLPFGGHLTALGLWASAVASLVLVAYSVARWAPRRAAADRPVATAPASRRPCHC
ncbi:MAG: PGPGW domain-containing protein [Nocardioidaceae bacterium]|nr:PGPGW domain-containing protein [Nocardioidaceae bacterium]